MLGVFDLILATCKSRYDGFALFRIFINPRLETITKHEIGPSAVGLADLTLGVGQDRFLHADVRNTEWLRRGKLTHGDRQTVASLSNEMIIGVLLHKFSVISSTARCFGSV